MANIGKRFLSAFMEVTEDEMPVTIQEEKQNNSSYVPSQKSAISPPAEKFRQYFDQLFKEANLPGPDYFEFSKMIEAMQAVADERARYTAAFAGLSVQGLNKEQLLVTASTYLKMLEADANNFHATVDAALKEKVSGKQAEIEAKRKGIEELSQEINALQQSIIQLQQAVKENEEKIISNSTGYTISSDSVKQKIITDIEKIKQHI